MARSLPSKQMSAGSIPVTRSKAMNDPAEQYIDLTRELWALRERTGDVDCPEEDELLDRMDVCWAALTREQIGYVEKVIEDERPQGC